MIKYIGDDNNWYSFLSELFNLLRSYKNMLAYLNIFRSNYDMLWSYFNMVPSY